MSDSVSQLQRKFNKKELAQELFKLRAQVRTEEAQDPNIRDAEARAGVAALENVTNLSPEEMASAMTKLGVGLNNTVQSITSEIIQGRNTLADLERACTTKRNELENLFGQEVMGRTIGALIADHDTKKKEFQAQEEELAEQLSRQEAQNERQQQEWEALFSKDCERKRQNFQYEFTQEQRQVKDQLSQQLQTERRQFDDQQREREREWNIREENLQKREQEVSEREAKAASLEEDIKAKAEKDKKSAIDAISRQHKHEMALAQKEAETAAQIAKSTIDNLKLIVAGQKAEIEGLKVQVNTATQKNTELAQSALESASRSYALNAVMQQGSGENGSTTRRKN